MARSTRVGHRHDDQRGKHHRKRHILLNDARVDRYLLGASDDREWETDVGGFGRVFPHAYGNGDSPYAPGYLNSLNIPAGYIEPETWDRKAAIDRIKSRFNINGQLFEKYAHPYLYFTKDVNQDRRIDRVALETAVVEELSEFQGVSLAVSSAALRRGEIPDTPLYRSVLNNFHAKRPGDVYIVFEPNWFINDFARGCGLPSDDLTECLRIACTREGRAIDIGRMNKHFFINVASMGFGAEITATTPVELKKRLGGGAYTLMGMVKAMNLTPYTGRLLIPGQDPIEGNMLFGAVGNNHFAGGGFDIAPNAELDDGLLDLTAIMQSPGFSLTELARELENPMNPDNRFVAYRQLPEFTIDADQPLHCNLDGEPVSKKKLRFSILPRHLKLAY